MVIKGPESIIRDIDKINTKAININNLKSASNGDVRLDLPEYVEVYNGENLVNYRIDVQKKSDSDKDDGKEAEEDEWWNFRRTRS